MAAVEAVRETLRESGEPAPAAGSMTFQITSTADESKAPPESGMGLRAVKCKKAVLP